RVGGQRMYRSRQIHHVGTRLHFPQKAVAASLRGGDDRKETGNRNDGEQSRNATSALEHASIIGKFASRLAGPPSVGGFAVGWRVRRWLAGPRLIGGGPRDLRGGRPAGGFFPRRTPPPPPLSPRARRPPPPPARAPPA